jgi:hypothetical protein
MRRSLRTATLLLAVVSLVALPLAGCSSSGSGSSLSSDAAAPAIGGQKLNVQGGKSEGTLDTRQVIKSGSMSITVSHPVDAADDATRIVESAGGRIDNRTEHAATDGGKGTASLLVRIPSAKLSPTLDRLKTLGTVEDLTISSDDVTAQAQDLDARISALRTSVTRLQSLMASATSTQDLITIESALSERQGNLESMESQQRQLKDQIDLSSITLSFSAVPKPHSELPGNFLDGFVVGWNSIVAFFAGLLVVVGVLLPWLVIAAAIAFGVLALVRVRRRQKLAPAQEEKTPPNAS